MHPPPNLFAPYPAIKPLNILFIQLIIRLLFIGTLYYFSVTISTVFTLIFLIENSIIIL